MTRQQGEGDITIRELAHVLTDARQRRLTILVLHAAWYAQSPNVRRPTRSVDHPDMDPAYFTQDMDPV